MRPGTLVRRYVLRGTLGRGGMGEVWLGERHGPEGVLQRVAIKLLRRDVDAPEDLGERLVDELRLAARLRHPHVCALVDFGELDEGIFLAFELLEGRGLDVLVRHLAARPVPDALALLARVV